MVDVVVFVYSDRDWMKGLVQTKTTFYHWDQDLKKKLLLSTYFESLSIEYVLEYILKPWIYLIILVNNPHG